MLELKFEKYHGLGNDFIIFDFETLKNNNIHENDFPKLAIKVCNRNTGIGADGMMVLKYQEESNSCKMFFLNCDGSVSSMCGNGIRCFSNYIYNHKILDATKYKVDTLAGLLTLEVSNEDNFTTKVNMGRPSLNPSSIPVISKDKDFLNKKITVDNVQYDFSAVLMGVAHGVIFVEDLKKVDVAKIGKLIENHDIFPENINVNFVEIISKNEIKVKAWERGAGLTLACGTGACASVVVGNLLNHLDSKVLVHLTLGDLEVEFKEDVFMTGPSELIAKGFYIYK